MKFLSPTIFLLAVLLIVPVSSMASGSHDHDHETTTASEHHSATGDGGMAIVGSMSSKGVKGMAHIKDVRDAMAKLGAKATHHFMIAFVNEETGEQISHGTVALKLTNPDAKVSDTVELVGMDGHFGVDLVLDMAGEYHFRLGTKLEDGVKRKYHFHYVN